MHQFVQVKKFQHSSKATDGASSNNTKQNLCLCLAKASPSFTGDEESSVKGARAMHISVGQLIFMLMIIPIHVHGCVLEIVYTWPPRWTAF